MNHDAMATRVSASRTITTLLIGLVVVSCTSSPTGTPDPDPTPANAVPIAQAGASQTVSATIPVTVDGSASTDADGDPLTYAWTLSTVPGGSTATLDNATAATSTFTPDVAGAYVLQLVVSDGTDASSPTTVTITAEDNTSKSTIGSGGGMLSSVDGAFSLDIPAGALSADEEISVTMVPANQYPEEIADLEDGAVVYEMRPDGLQFDLPVRVEVTPAGLGPTTDADGTTIPVLAMATLSDGTIEVADQLELTLDVPAGTSTLVGQIEHFSRAIAYPIGPESEVFLTIPNDRTELVGEPFNARVRVGAFLFDEATFTLGMIDASAAPVSVSGTFNSTLLSGFGFAYIDNNYQCDYAGPGMWGARFEITSTAFAAAIGGTVGESRTLPVHLFSKVDCVEPITEFTPFDLLSPEAFSPLDEPIAPGDGSAPLAFTREAGATVTTGSGTPVAEFEAAALAGAGVFGVAAFSRDGLMVNTSDGLYVSEGAIPTTPVDPVPTRTLTRVPQPMTGPDLSANATDLMTFGDDLATLGAFAVMFGVQDIAFFTTGTASGGPAGFVFRDDLAEAFKPGGVSVFGTDIPVTAFVGPTGWTETNPMLVATIDPVTRQSTLWLAEQVAGLAVITPVDNIFPADEVRQLRCLATICAITGYGTGFGFGGVTIFKWDGANTFTPIQGLSVRAIGVSLRLSATGTILIANTSFSSNLFVIHEVSLAGEYLNSYFGDLSGRCVGPGFIWMRLFVEAIIACNTSNQVIREPFVF